MLVFQGIQLILAHCLNLIQSIGAWFNNLPLVEVWSDILPNDIIAVVSVCIGLMLVMAAIGLIKKLSFLLG